MMPVPLRLQYRPAAEHSNSLHASNHAQSELPPKVVGLEVVILQPLALYEIMIVVSTTAVAGSPRIEQ
jgi:hypothetical protein